MIDFISGLPRSGSTLLAAILRQNPALSADISSPLCAMTQALVSGMARPESAVFFSDTQRDFMVLSLIEAYCLTRPSADVVDTSRSWTGHLPLIAKLYPDAHVICCVRNLGWIVNSFERILARHPLRASGMFNFRADASVYDRAADLMDERRGVIGKAYARLKQAWFGEHAKRLIVIDYESLIATPRLIVAELYDICGWATYQHRFDDVEFDSPKFDESLGIPGLHRVSGPVRSENPQLVIPPDLFDRYADSAFWKAPQMNFRAVKVLGSHLRAVA